MSSHHIVKEKQEPALYLDELGNFDDELLGQLLEWSPTLLVNVEEYEKALSLGLKIDIVVGENTEVIPQENTKFLSIVQSAKQTALAYLVAEKYPAVNIIGNTDSFETIADLLPQINIVLLTETYKTIAIKTGFNIWKPKGTIFKLADTTNLNTDNLEKISGNDFVVVNDGFVSFQFDTEYLFISEKL